MTKTEKEYREASKQCEEIFVKKMEDYGTAWRIMRPTSITDQIMIKARRIRSLEIKGERKVDEGIQPEFIGIINYAAMALIQLKLGFIENPEMDHQEALTLYREQIETAFQLMNNKNHDYDEAWRAMRISSLTDLILMKLNRTKEIEDHKGETLISEGVDANYLDMINYAMFALIRFAEN
ncbi:MAG: DUF1599 domain-containing protein [Marinilabiliaceae bacterium]|nr:DUF1599 domain-containing protein [Marinilabiliaceae bacterium]